LAKIVEAVKTFEILVNLVIVGTLAARGEGVLHAVTRRGAARP